MSMALVDCGAITYHRAVPIRPTSPTCFIPFFMFFDFHDNDL